MLLPCAIHVSSTFESGAARSYCVALFTDSPFSTFFQRTMAREWRPAFCMLICSLDGQWNHDPWFKEDHFVDSVRFSIVPVEGDSHILPFYFFFFFVPKAFQSFLVL